jgi:xanthine phosphoribosyltransferase
MNLLEERIRREGKLLPGGVVKVDSFLNHQIDPVLADTIADEFIRRFQDEKITKVLTIEASGIAFAVLVALKLKVPLVFAKKIPGRNQGSDSFYSSSVISFTKGVENTIRVSRKFLDEGDSVLVVDDFLAMGEACKGLCSIVEQAGAHLVGVGIVIEKGFQPGGENLRSCGIRVESLARIMDITEAGTITFA